ncbi:MAG: cysteine desulfurase [Kiritimatiellia bacterium]|jgi:cysteine desulfurase
MTDPIYLDYNATTPIDPRVADAMRPYLGEIWGNPSSSHCFGQPAKLGLEKARGQAAKLLACQPAEITFTSGGTESNNMALIGTMRALRDQGRHLITSAVEHPAINQVCEYLIEYEGCSVTYLPVDDTCMVKLDDVRAAITDETVLISIMHANNEVGTIQPIRAIADLAHAHGIRMHTDAAQAVGKISTRVDALGVDLLSIAGHKLYAPKGVGLIYLREGITLAPVLHGAGQENGVRAGTENILEIAGLGEACEIIADEAPHDARLRDRLQAGLLEAFPDARVNGHAEHRLPNTLSISFPGRMASDVIARLERVCCSAGAACHSDTVEVSAVLQAMEVPMSHAPGTLRLSTGRMTTEAEVDGALVDLVRAVKA